MAVLVMRIIPTRVGTRPSGYFVKFGNWDHPHACGDKDKMICLDCGNVGSSPRVWGQGYQAKTVYLVCRIIPTRVGTS